MTNMAERRSIRIEIPIPEWRLSPKLRFSSRILLVAVATVAVYCTFFLRPLKIRSQKNKTAVVAVLEAGGTFLPGTSSGPYWLHDYLSQDYSQIAVEIETSFF